MLVDFREARGLLARIVGRFDHKLLNEVIPFDTLSPTAENLARLFYDELNDAFGNCKLDGVRVWETSSACACYRGEV